MHNPRKQDALQQFELCTGKKKKKNPFERSSVDFTRLPLSWCVLPTPVGPSFSHRRQNRFTATILAPVYVRFRGIDKVWICGSTPREVHTMGVVSRWFRVFLNFSHFIIFVRLPPKR